MIGRESFRLHCSCPPARTGKANLSWSPDGFQNETELRLSLLWNARKQTLEKMSAKIIILTVITLMSSVSSDYYSEDGYYSTHDQIYRRQDDFDTVRVIDEGISNVLSALPGQVITNTQSLCVAAHSRSGRPETLPRWPRPRPTD